MRSAERSMTRRQQWCASVPSSTERGGHNAGHAARGEALRGKRATEVDEAIAVRHDVDVATRGYRDDVLARPQVDSRRSRLDASAAGKNSERCARSGPIRPDGTSHD